MRKAILLYSQAMYLLLVLYLALFSNQLNATAGDITCNRSPVITCPQNYFGCAGDSTNPDDVGWATAVPGEEGCEIPEISYSDTMESDDECDGGILIKRLWRAEYPNNSNPWLFAECTQIILLEDDGNPVIQDCPADIVVDVTNSCSSAVSWTVPVASDDCQLSSFTSNYDPGAVFSAGVTTVTYTATDACGNKESCSFTVTVVDNCCSELPVITCPSAYNGCIGDDITPAAIGSASGSVSTNQCGDAIVSFTDVIIGTVGDCANSQVIDRIWTAALASDTTQTATCTQRITLDDNVAPQLISCLPNMEHSTISRSGIVINYQDPVATDDCGIRSIVPNIPSGSVFLPGVTTVTFTISDFCGNTTTCSFDITVILVLCQDPPVITCPSDYIGCVSGGIMPSTTGQATAVYTGMSCDSDPEISYTDIVISTGDCAGEQEIERTWWAVNPDDATMTVSCVQNITISDDVAPSIISCPSNITVNTASSGGAIVNFTNVNATDNCGIESISYSHPAGGTYPLGTTTVSVMVTDLCGNTASCSFTITVVSTGCNEVPSMVCPADFSGCVGTSDDPQVTGQASASFTSASCSSVPAISYSDLIIAQGACSAERVIQRTWKATNPENNSQFATCIQMITIEDQSGPTIIECQDDIEMSTVSAGGIIVLFDDPVVSDDCGIGSIVASHLSGSAFLPGTTTVEFTVTDLCGKTTSCSFNVIVTLVTCQESPIISCPADYVGCISDGSAPAITGVATANYNSNTCSSVPEVSYKDVVTSQGDCQGAQVIQRTWTATNPSDELKTSTCVQMISIGDDSAPVITNCPGDITLTVPNTTYTWTLPDVTDDCGATLTSDIANGSSFSLGVTTVTFSAIDDCGNISTCSFDVTVEEENVGSTLVINCPDDLIILCDEDDAINHVPLPEVNTDCERCNGGEIPGFVYMGIFDGNRYYCSRDKAIWPVAQSVCRSNGGYLAKIDNKEENNFLASKLQTSSAYIGLSDAASEGHFVWTDGSDSEYVNWYPKQPNNYRGYQDYVEILSNGLWNDQDNNKPLEYIMEIPCYTITRTAGPDAMADIDEPTTITYEVSDACGNIQTCSFDILIEQETSLSCPSDIQVQTSGSFAHVSYDLPQLSSCCQGDDSLDPGFGLTGYVYMGYWNGSYYFCSRDDASWHTANAECRKNGGYLAIIDSPEENHFLANQLTNQKAFIGVSDHISEGNYHTVNNGAQQYFNWDADQPNNYKSTQHYIELHPDGYWNDTYGDVKREYIMEIPAHQALYLLEGYPSGAAFPIGTTTVTYEAIDACGNSSACSFDITVSSTDTGSSDYCESYGASSAYGYIKESKVDNYIFRSGNNGGYGNLTDHCINVTEGGTFDIKFSPGFRSYRYYCYYHIYIDYNGDGDFEDHRELIATAKSANTVSGTLPVLLGSKTGHIRMRVIMSLNGYPDSACDIVRNGEVEDYCLNVTSSGTSYIGKSRTTTSRIELSSEGNLKGSSFGEITPSLITPNPVQTSLSIHYDDRDDISAVAIMDMNGREVMVIDNVSTNVDVSDLIPGLYMMRMILEDGTQLVEKFIVE